MLPSQGVDAVRHMLIGTGTYRWYTAHVVGIRRIMMVLVTYTARAPHKLMVLAHVDALLQHILVVLMLALLVQAPACCVLTAAQ